MPDAPPTSSPIICFGQQPCGFFPKRFLVAKIHTARKLQSEIGGQIVFFYHDADHDPRETRTILRHRQSGQPNTLNFEFENKIQRKYSPLSLKRIPPLWHRNTANALPNYVDSTLVDAFRLTTATLVADFCLDIYRRMGLLDGIQVVRSSDPALRRAACDIPECYADIPYQNEIVRARVQDNTFTLHEGGNAFINLPPVPFTKDQISPTRDTRLRWMQSVVHCTHYVCGAGEQAYLRKEDAPEITYVPRQTIERSDEAYTDIP
jgi:hypothetical protein